MVYAICFDKVPMKIKYPLFASLTAILLLYQIYVLKQDKTERLFPLKPQYNYCGAETCPGIECFNDQKHCAHFRTLKDCQTYFVGRNCRTVEYLLIYRQLDNDPDGYKHAQNVYHHEYHVLLPKFENRRYRYRMEYNGPVLLFKLLPTWLLLAICVLLLISGCYQIARNNAKLGIERAQQIIT